MLGQSLVSQPQPVSISHLNLSDTALVSPGDMTWDNQRPYSVDTTDVFSWNYYTLPPSPPASVGSNADDSPQVDRRMVKPRFTPELQSEKERKPCLPTNQVFELDGVEVPSSSSSSPAPSIPHQLTLSTNSGPPLKKSFATIGGAKKGRGNGERITTKDFVPPDVTGLSKREARLLKNRAAAFLSRQRKREEFEAMEIRVKELEEENSRLQMLAARGKKYDDLASNMEQLRLRLSVAEKRERELAVELANQAATNLAVKTESHELNLPPSPYSSYATTGQPSIITVMKKSLLSSLPSLLSLPSQTTLPVSFSAPLTGTSSAMPSSASLSHQSASSDIKDQGRPRFGHGSVEFHPSSADVSSKKMAVDGKGPEACQFDVDGHHCTDSVAISFEASLSEDGRGYVHVHVSEKHAKPTINGSRQRPSSLTCWPGADPSFGMACYASPPLSAQVSVPSPGGIDHLGVFTSTGDGHSRMGFDTQLVPSGYTTFAQHEPEQSFDYYSGGMAE